jgi:hypothetical protein
MDQSHSFIQSLLSLSTICKFGEILSSQFHGTFYLAHPNFHTFIQSLFRLPSKVTLSSNDLTLSPKVLSFEDGDCTPMDVRIILGHDMILLFCYDIFSKHILTQNATIQTRK